MFKNNKLNTSPAQDNQDKMNCVIYTRVSSEEQTHNFSLASQEMKCRQEAERMGYSVLEVFREAGASAKSIKGRPELLKLMAYCEKNHNDIAAILVYRIDRLSREVSDFLILRKKFSDLGIKFVSISEPSGEETSTGKFVEMMLSGIAQLDNDIRSERTKQGLRARFLQGLPINQPPLGYTSQIVDGKAIPVAKEVEFMNVQRLFETFATGTISLKQLAVMANKWGLRTNRSKMLTSKSLSRTLNNPFYYGILKYNVYPEEVVGKHPPAITEQLFFKVQDILRGRNTLLGKNQKNKENPLFPLRGLIYCDKCKSNLVSGRCKGRSKYYNLYWCSNNCTSSIQSERLEDKLKTLLGYVKFKQESIDLFFIVLTRNYQRRIEDYQKVLKIKEKKELEVMNKISDLVEDRKTMPKEIYENLIKKYKDELLIARIIKNDTLLPKYDLEGTQNFVRKLLSDLAKAYDVSTYSQKRILIGSIFPHRLSFLNGDILNHDINPIFRDIRNPEKIRVASGVADVPYFEPHIQLFQQLFQAYPDYKQQFAYANL